MTNYPQTKFRAKVIFLHLSVILFMGGWYPSMHYRWYPSMPCSRSPGGWYPSMPCSLQGGCPGPHPGGKLRGLARGVSRPTLGGLQAHTGRVSRTTPGGVSRPTPGGGSPGPHPVGGLQAHTWGVPRPTPGGCIPACTEADTPPVDGYCRGRYASYWNAFLY